ncbi:hypothetical protein [Cypionkella sp.]|uniref:hypothetical protein n=1 Tax=Cypionkella sp. TaxID=2811411 RepID=UPI002ABB1A56|nr:hypothetical protein [Cypionkella sp.]MDZ4396015.1 hypothetical protein [Cypionkella sp.]
MKTFMLGTLIAFLPTFASAAGQTTSRLDCKVSSSCTQNGDCVVTSKAVAFTLTEKAVERHGEGTYEIAYQGVTADAQNLTMFGPYMWVVGDNEELHTLVILGATPSNGTGTYRFLWSEMHMTDQAFSTVKFLTCEGNF